MISSRNITDAIIIEHAILSFPPFFYFRVTVELARGTPHGRDRERWGDGRGGGRYDRGGRGDRDR